MDSWSSYDGSAYLNWPEVEAWCRGLAANHPQWVTLEEVGQQFSVTRERIRQIEAKALRKLKHPSRSRKLRSFLES